MSGPLPNVARANAFLAAAWSRGILTRPSLDPATIEHLALRGGDPAAFGADDGWRDRLRRLTRALRDQADLNPLGRTMAHRQLLALLHARLRATALRDRLGPDGSDGRPAPIVIAGQMRSGTTRMQRLLACDPQFAVTRTFESLTPVPSFGRRMRAHAILAGLHWLNPETRRIHPARADDPEEEYGWLAYGFCPAQFEAQWRIPSFSRWSEQADAQPCYRDFRMLLELNASARRADRSKPWVLKAPQYMQDLGVMLDAFPGARVIRLHRDRADVVASSASLVWNQMRIQSDGADKAWIGREWLRKTTLREERAAEALTARPSVPVVHVAYDAMSRDWRQEMRRVYDCLDCNLTSDVTRRMERWMASARTHLGHRYAAEDFGISRAGMASAR